MNPDRRTELLNQIDLLAKERGIVAIKDTARLNAENYAREQLKYSPSKGRLQEELEIEWLERHLHSLEDTLPAN